MYNGLKCITTYVNSYCRDSIYAVLGIRKFHLLVVAASIVGVQSLSLSPKTQRATRHEAGINMADGDP